jgi:hypothetical protein
VPDEGSRPGVEIRGRIGGSQETIGDEMIGTDSFDLNLAYLGNNDDRTIERETCAQMPNSMDLTELELH